MNAKKAEQFFLRLNQKGWVNQPNVTGRYWIFTKGNWNVYVIFCLDPLYFTRPRFWRES